MGSKMLHVLLVLMFFMYLCVFATSSPIIQKDLSSDSSRDVDMGDKDIQHEHGTGYAYGKDYARGREIAHGTGFREHIGGSTGTSEHGNNGGSGTPYTYAGGATSNRHPNTHHGAGNCKHNCAGLSTSILTAIATHVHLYIEWQN